MENLQTFREQLTRSGMNKVVYYGTLLLAVLFGIYSLIGLDEPVDRTSAHMICFGAMFIYGINVLITLLHGENQNREDLVTRDYLQVGIAGLSILGALIALSGWAYLLGLVVVIWVVALKAPDTHHEPHNVHEPTPREYAMVIALCATVAIGLGVLGGVLIAG